MSVENGGKVAEPVFQLSLDEVRATLIFLSVAKSAYEFIGRMVGDGEERFASNRIMIESLSMKYRDLLSRGMLERAKAEMNAEIVASGLDTKAPGADIAPKESISRSRGVAKGGK